MRYKTILSLSICVATLALGGCLDLGEPVTVADVTPPPSSGTPPPTPPPTTPPPTTPPPMTPPPTTPPPPPPPPPVGEITSIPDIPFEYQQEPGTATATGILPATIGAGEVLNFTLQNVNQDLSISCSGTEQNPAFIIGGTLQGDNDVFSISGSWCIFVGTIFDNIQPRTNGDHHIFRNVEIRNLRGKNGSSFRGTNMVITDSEIHHNQGDDRHGIFVASGADSIWILRNEIHHNGGDGFQACHLCSANPPRNVYIGANLFYSDRENGIDLKYIEDVIIEGNVFHSLVRAPAGEMWCFDDGSGCGVFSSGSDGSAILVGSAGGPTNVQIINNEIYNTVNAIRIEEGVQIAIVGNNFHDLASRCLQLDKDGFNTVFTDNTCRNANRGINQNWRSNFSLFVERNSFENITEAAVNYEARSVCEAGTLVENSFTNSGAVICGNTAAASQADINALPGASGNTVN